MQTIDFNFNSDKNGGKIIGFNYSRSLNELVGTWSAEVANGNFKAGDSISFGNDMTGGIITKAYKDSYGLWHIEGKDAGIKLMKTTPDVSELPEGNAKTVIQSLASRCGMQLVMSGNGLSGFNVRSVVSGSTCAEAILELAMLSGYIAYIGNNGALNVVVPSSTLPNFNKIINDTGSDIDLDGYATQVAVVINRRKLEDEEEGVERYIGTTPSENVQYDTVSGSFPNGTYSIRTIQPLNVVDTVRTTITHDNVRIDTKETHEYERRTKTIWRENQEYVLFAFFEKGYELEKITEGNYGSGITFKETTTETMEREFAMGQDDNVPEDWQTDLQVIGKDTITRSTIREGGKPPTSDMPDYAPEYDSKIVRTYRNARGGRTCTEEETTYEMRQVGSISPIKIDGQTVPHFLFGSNLAIQTHKTPEWVPIKTKRVYYEKIDEDGECQVSTRSEFCDDGAEWLIENGITETGDNDLDEYQKSYAKFSQQSHGLDVSFGSSGAFPTTWQFVELKGRRKVKGNEWINELGDISGWYINGEYAKLDTCPHYQTQDKKCGACPLLGKVDYICRFPKMTRGCWPYCDYAKEILERVREYDKPLLEIPVIGTASKGAASVGYQREIYIDEIIEDNVAQNIANTIAQNILIVKSIKGFRKTVTVPYNASYVPNGVISAVSHDWQNMQSTVTYHEDGTVPEFMISESISSIANFVSLRENARRNIPKYGKISDVTKYDKGFVSVDVDNSTISCMTKLKNLGEGDIVLVSFPSGNRLRGQVIARL